MSEIWIVRSNVLAFRPTMDTDLGRVLTMERDQENRQYIRQWSLEKHQAAITDPDIAHFIIETVPEKRMVGYVILIGLENPDQSIEFKRIVIADKGHGHGRQAVQLIKKYTFEMLNKHRLWLEVMDHNHRAFELYRSVGFITEGTHREAVKQGDVYTSLHVMSILAAEYFQKSMK